MKNLKKYFLIIILACIFVFPFGYESLGQSETTQQPTKRVKTIYKRRTVIDFSDIIIQGKIKRPSGIVIFRRGGKKFRGLIKIREDFNENLKKSIKKIGW